MNVDKTLYDILEVTRNASREVIEASHQHLRDKFDPETPGNPRDDASRLRFKAIREAFVTLSNPERRKHYDNRLRSLERVEMVEVFWTPTRIFIIASCLILAASMYWKHRSDEAKTELARVVVEKEKAAKVEAVNKEREEAIAAQSEFMRRQIQERRQQAELDNNRRYIDQVARQSENERANYERQLQMEQQRADAARQRERQTAEANARREAAQEQARLRQLEYERLRGR